MRTSDSKKAARARPSKMRGTHVAERLRRRTIEFLAEGTPWGVDEDIHPARLDPVEDELDHALTQREATR